MLARDIVEQFQTDLPSLKVYRQYSQFMGLFSYVNGRLL